MLTSRSRAWSRNASTLVEVTVGIGLGVIVVITALAMLGLVSRSELAVRSRADATDAAALAHSHLSRDLAVLQYDGRTLEIEVADVTTPGGAFKGGALSFTILTPAGTLAGVRWSFDPVHGVLNRDEDGARPRRFALGSGALVRFARVDPGFAHGQAPTLGYFGNRLVYRISVASDTGPGLTLIGAEVLSVKASRDTFPYFNFES